MVSQAVDKAGKIIAGSDADDAIFGFRPVDIKCNPNGVTTWSSAGADSNRFLFEVKDLENYPSAMRKLGTSSRTVAAIKAISLGIIEL